MRILILGCGVVGGLVARRLIAAGHEIVGVRRTPDAGVPGVTLVPGDAADETLHQRLGGFEAVLIAANPGIRRGRDNGVRKIAALMARLHGSARVVYTGTTSLYGDAAGGGVDESSPIADTVESASLLAIETELLHHENALVLRATALVGPSRTFVRDRIRAAAGVPVVVPFVVKGDLDRPFSYVHEDDLADLCVRGLLNNPPENLGRGVLNVAAPTALTVRGYYQLQAALAGVSVTLTSDGGQVPSRRIDARRLQALIPGFTWREPG